MRLYQKMVKSISVLLLFCLMTVLVSASTPGGTFGAETSSPLPQTVTGTLKVSGSGTVLLNGNTATDGATVLSDSQIQTQNGAQATVNFAHLGKLEIGCNSTVKITFTNDSVTATVVTGFAELTTNQGINGTLMTDDGKVLKTNSASRSSVQSPNGNPCGKIVPPSAASSSGFGIGAALAVAIGGAVAVAIFAANKSGPHVVSNVK